MYFIHFELQENIQKTIHEYFQVKSSTNVIQCISQCFQQSTANPELVKEDTTGFSVFFWWTCGITLLTMALFISARMGIYQEVLYKQHGKHPRESLYVTVSQFFAQCNNVQAISDRIETSTIRKYHYIVAEPLWFC